MLADKNLFCCHRCRKTVGICDAQRLFIPKKIDETGLVMETIETTSEFSCPYCGTGLKFTSKRIVINGVGFYPSSGGRRR